MATIDKPITERHGYKEGSRRDAFQRELGALAEKHGLLGIVLIEFGREHVGCRSWARTDEFCKAMDTLGTRILTDIDDGRHDPLEQMDTEGRA